MTLSLVLSLIVLTALIPATVIAFRGGARPPDVMAWSCLLLSLRSDCRHGHCISF